MEHVVIGLFLGRAIGITIRTGTQSAVETWPCFSSLSFPSFYLVFKNCRHLKLYVIVAGFSLYGFPSYLTCLMLCLTLLAANETRGVGMFSIICFYLPCP